MDDNLHLLPVDTSAPGPGELIAGRFRIIKLLAKGSWSAIYKAYQLDSNMEVALKILNTSHEKDPTIAERFRREALFVSQLSHINTITFLDYGDTGSGTFFIAMEYLEGMTLGQILEQGPIEPDHALTILKQICASLAEVHNIGVLHRDLKPDNIFVCSKTSLNCEPFDAEIVKVLDFGIAKATQGRVQGIEGTLEGLTHKGLLIGTPLYMAPEQILEQELTPAADIYALGHILFEMLAGYAAMETGGDDPIEVIMRHVEDDMPPLPDALQNTALAVVISRATAKDPLDRFPDAAALLDFLNLLPAPKSKPTGRLPRTQRNIPAGDQSATKTLILDNLTAQIALDHPDGDAEVSEESVKELHHLLQTTSQSSQCNLAVFPEHHSIKALIASLTDESHEEGPVCVLRSDKAHPLGEVWSAVDTLLGLNAEEICDASNALTQRIAQGFPQRDTVVDALQTFRTQTFNVLEHPISDLRNKRKELISALVQPFVALSSEALLVWCIEDLHLTDPLTLTVLNALISLDEAVSTKLLVVLTMNADQFQSSTHKAKPLISLLSHPSPSIHVISPAKATTVHDVRRLISGCLNGDAVSHMLAQALLYSSGGQRMLLQETVHHLKSEQLICIDPEGAWSLDPSQQDTYTFPNTLDALLTDKLNSRWSQQNSRLLHAVALLHNEATVETVSELLLQCDASLDRAQLAQGIQEALALRYLREDEQKLAFVLPNMRWALLKHIEVLSRAAQPDPPTVQMLSLARTLLVERFPSPPCYLLGHIARLLVNLQQHKLAGEYLRTFADRCLSNFNIDAAIDALLKGLRYSRQTSSRRNPVKLFTPENSEEFLSFLKLGECYAILGDLGIAQDHLNHALNNIAVLGDRSLEAAQLQARTFLIEGELASLNERFEEADKYLSLATKAFSLINHEPGVTRSTVALARLQLRRGDPQTANTALLNLKTSFNSAPLQVQLQHTLARSYFRTNAPEKALDSIDEALDRLGHQRDPSKLAELLLLRAEIQFFMGTFDEASTAFQKTIALSNHLESPSKATQASFRLAAVHAARGHLDKSWELLTSISDMTAQTHDPISAAYAELLLADIYAAQVNYLPGAELKNIIKTYLSIITRSRQLRSSRLLFMALTRLLITCVRSDQIEFANQALNTVLGEITLPSGIQSLNPLFIWLKSTQNIKQEEHHQLIDHITKSQIKSQHDVFFLSCFLMSDACCRRQDLTRTQAFMRLACQQALLNGRIVEATQSRLELMRTGFYEGETLPPGNSLLLGPIMTLPITEQETTLR